MTQPLQDPAPPEDKEQPLIAHLLELRTRLLRCVVAVLLAFGALSWFANDLYTLLARPLTELLPEGSTMIATEVAAPFLAPFKLTLVVAIFLALPYVLHQVWRFVVPGLYAHERRLVMPLVVSSTVLFYLGVAFAYFIVFPVLFGFFTATAPTGVAVMTDINKYLDFVLTMFVAFGAIFEIPVATVLLVWIGVVDKARLKALRPYVIVGCFVVGALLTPPDVISQCLLAIPMWLLYEGGVLVSGWLPRREEDAQGEPSIHPALPAEDPRPQV